ncbi:hypothetical protein [Agromyces sp. M3QZ16-3]|uniref:hypothetical protein n=1 Tax=Agromyces sp. M3QZ16-3 TaxID=3447585 RepID=UPI003F693292
MPEKRNIGRALDARLVNPDVTLARLVEAGQRLSELDGTVSVPTLIGDWYVYHQLPEGVDEMISSEHVKVLAEFGVIDLDATLGSVVEANALETALEKAGATLVGPWYVYKSGIADDGIEEVIITEGTR